MTKDTRKRFTFRMPKELHNELEKEARKQGTSINALILQILWEWVEDNEQKESSHNI